MKNKRGAREVILWNREGAYESTDTHMAKKEHKAYNFCINQTKYVSKMFFISICETGIDTYNGGDSTVDCY